MAWKYKVSNAGATLLSAAHSNKADVALSAVVVNTPAKQERMLIAKSITEAWFGPGPDASISASVDTPGETREIADWLNYSVAPDVHVQSVYWRWSYCDASELSKLKMKSDFALLCYTHLTAKITAKIFAALAKGAANA